MSGRPTVVELRAESEAQALILIAKYQSMGPSFLRDLTPSQKSLLVGFLAEAWCAGALVALREVGNLPVSP